MLCVLRMAVHACRAVSGTRERRYRGGMKSHRLSRNLRRSALAVLLLGVLVWAAAGARLGWTQTSTVTMQRDEITGIEYPVRQDAFRPGVEVPALALAFAGALAGLGWVTARRAEPAKP